MPRVSSKSATALVKEKHHNSKLDDDAISDLAYGHLIGKSDADMAATLGVHRTTVLRKLRSIELPEWFPEPGDVSQCIKDLYEIALLKGLYRLAHNGMELMDLKTLPVSIGICTDKLQVLNGQPTSFSLQLHAKVSQGDLEQKYESLQASKSQVIDAETVKQDDKRT